MIDDTANYTISTKIPKGITKIFDATDRDDGWLSPFSFFNALFGLTGAGLVLLITGLFLLPLILLILLLVYIFRIRRREREKDMIEATATAVPAAEKSDNGQKKAGYTHRRDNAIRNMILGAAISLASYVLGISIGSAAGIIILGIGIADYLIYLSHRND